MVAILLGDPMMDAANSWWCLDGCCSCLVILGHSGPRKQYNIKITEGSSNMPPGAGAAGVFMVFTIPINNTTAEIRHFCAVAFKAGHSSFTRDNFKI